ncbi:hypothetical protein [Leuconostoc pseudomesenteroides]|uniref:Uncharacterized protein n=1 Tax=Leuconostoc pseudomesenteroides TaxID=33968 RepID=A0ABT6HG68_LEUPS|nr:hypothetical protein [Leuconostoc pseudomesenteroides]MDG9734143.1 hypothetical protein [Leuconostoc pseudomesenteroides]NKZ35328.1 hypothetical protein [Leuconostoc pseudomesenteroides]QQB27771.1 hypothetical protein I6H60_01885 [Leuconostoc pseudomesenteroides]
MNEKKDSMQEIIDGRLSNIRNDGRRNDEKSNNWLQFIVAVMMSVGVIAGLIVILIQQFDK